MTTPGHRQYNPLFVLRQAALYLQEAPEVLGRRHQPEGKVGQLPYERSNMYPSYYQNNFHFQTDGWFSSRSADTYDVATETLFLGRQDAMQRGTLLAINRCATPTPPTPALLLHPGFLPSHVAVMCAWQPCRGHSGVVDSGWCNTRDHPAGNPRHWV